MQTRFNRPNIAAQIKDRLTIREVCERYGVQFNQRGMANCPFHDDHHPSASFKNGRFHCFVCDLHLDIFDFVQKLFDVDFRQAILRLDSDFCLGLTNQKPDRAAYERWAEEWRSKTAELESYRAKYMRNTELYRYIWMAMKTAGHAQNDYQAIRRARWSATIEYLADWFDFNPWR